MVALVPRLTLRRAGPGRFATGSRVWGSTTARLPVHAPQRYTDVLTGVTIEARRGRLDIGAAFGVLPVSVLHGVAKPAR